ncbi:MAG: flagellin [Planctomycetota bacterium]
MRIGFNKSEAFAMHALERAVARRAQSMERLSTGLRINRAADDPSGLIASENLKAQVVTLEKRIQNAERSITYFGARDGALSVVSDMLIELQGTVTMAANRSGLSDGERQALQGDVDSILDALNFVGQTSQFNGQQLISDVSTSRLGNVSVEIENDDGTTETVSYSLADLSGELNLVDGDLEKAQKVIDAAIASNSAQRGRLGTQVREEESEIRLMQNELINTQDALSTIIDTDYAKETSELVRAQVQEQAALRMVQVSRQDADKVLQLLDGVIDPNA